MLGVSDDQPPSKSTHAVFFQINAKKMYKKCKFCVHIVCILIILSLVLEISRLQLGARVVDRRFLDNTMTMTALAWTGCGSESPSETLQDPSHRCFSDGFGLDRVRKSGATNTLPAPVL
jgi:hypothetical protein